MNYKRLAFLLAGLLAAVVVVTLIHHNRIRPAMTVESVSDVRRLKETLQLTPDQTIEIQRLHQELAKNLAALCGQHCQAQAALMDALFASTNGLERSQSLLDEMSTAQAASEKATLINMYRVRDVLTPRQREIYERQVKSMSCLMRHGGGGSVCGCMVK